MSRPQPHTLICTVGTSLFYPNLASLAENETRYSDLKKAFHSQDWASTATHLAQIPATERVCGAEINSTADLLNRGFIQKGRLHLLHSDTEEGESIATILESYFRLSGWEAASHRVEGLTDQDPRRFHTAGLRNLSRQLSAWIREAGDEYCAINATGGYKAQIAIAVLLGQALGVPVYYKHERFNEIISFPPMPVSLDLELWLCFNDLFVTLSRPGSCEPWEQFQSDWDERLDPLVDRVRVDEAQYLELSPTGQIFHETYRFRFKRSAAVLLPPVVATSQKQAPSLGEHDYKRARAKILHFLEQVTKQPYVRFCHSTYWNPDLPEVSRFRLSGGEIEGIFSDGSWCVKFRLLTSARHLNENRAAVADLNEWLEDNL